MSNHFYGAADQAGRRGYFRITVEPHGDHHRATCVPVRADGTELADAQAVAPAFYGVSPEQALRRMVQVLENTFGDVEAVSAERSRPNSES